MHSYDTQADTRKLPIVEKARKILSKSAFSDWIVYGLVAFLWLGYVFTNSYWLQTDTRPPFYDTASHAIESIQLERSLFHGNIVSAFKEILLVFPYPPLMYLVSAPFVFLFGPNMDALLGVNAVFLGILILSTYNIGYHFGGKRTGLLAMLLVCMYPIIYGLSRHYLLDVSLTAMVALTFWFLMRTENFKYRIPSLLFGISLGLGMLTKWTFAVFITAPLIISIVNASRAHNREQVKNLIFALLVGGLICGPWYVYHASNLITFLQRNGFQAAILEGDPLVGSWESWIFYIGKLMEVQILLPFTILFVLGLALQLKEYRMDTKSFMLFAWIVIPYLAFSIFVNKDARYTMPYLPAIALITALGVAQIRSKLINFGIVIVLIYAFFQFAGLTFGLSNRLPAGVLPPHLGSKVGVVSWNFYSERVHIASPPYAQDWQIQNIIRDIVDDSNTSGKSTDSVKLVVLPNAHFFEPRVFMYFVAIDHLPIEVSYIPSHRTVDSKTQLQETDYIVTKTGNQGPAWTLQNVVALTKEIQKLSGTLDIQIEQIAEYDLPDGSIAQLYRYVRSKK